MFLKQKLITVILKKLNEIKSRATFRSKDHQTPKFFS
jgi:hypothetical protein